MTWPISSGLTVSVQDNGRPQFVNFDRAHVTLNGQPLALRSVPPTLTQTAPVAITTMLEASGTTPIPVTVTAALYAWSDSDAKPAVQQTTTPLVLTPGAAVGVPFTWDKPEPGVYELVLTAKPENSTILPSLLKVRFPIAGDTPRIIFSGITKLGTDEAEITTCAVNGAGETGNGSVSTRLVGTDGKPFAIEAAVTNQLSSTVLRVPTSALTTSTVITTEARDSQGHTIDQNEISYGADVLPLATPTPTPAPKKSVAHPQQLAFIGLGIVIVLGGGLVWLAKRKPPSF